MESKHQKESRDSNLIGNRSALLRRCDCGALLHKFALTESVTCEGCGGEWKASDVVAPII